MVLLSLSALVLGVGLQIQPQTAPVPATAPPPVTEVIAMTRLKLGVALPDVMKLVQEEVRVAVQLYLDGKIDQWYTRGDGKGAVLILRCRTGRRSQGGPRRPAAGQGWISRCGVHSGGAIFRIAEFDKATSCIGWRPATLACTTDGGLAALPLQ